jgi:hypothetical protein
VAGIIFHDVGLDAMTVRLQLVEQAISMRNMTYDRIIRSFLVLEVVVMNIMSMSEILLRILGGIIVSISILDIIFSTDFHFGYQ